MQSVKTSLERAFEIAMSGSTDSVTDLRKRLDREGFDSRQVEGRQLFKQINDLIREARQIR